MIRKCYFDFKPSKPTEFGSSLSISLNFIVFNLRRLPSKEMAPAKGKGNVKKKGKGSSKITKSRAPESTSDSYFPREIISNILSRLPVNILLRFRCVCKQWRNLIWKPNFIAAHFSHYSALQRSGSSILIGTRHYESSHHVLSLYTPPPEPESSSSIVELDSPFPCFFPHMYIVGPCNGIVCLFQPPWGDLITLWNPAMRQSRMVKLSESEPIMGVHCWASIGLAFDPQENDFLVLRIFTAVPTSTVPNHVEMWSTKSFGWKKLKSEVVFHIPGHTSNVNVKGVPYWFATVTDEFGWRPVLVRFDVGKKVFEKLPMLGTGERNKKHQQLVVLGDSLGKFTFDERDESHFDVWVMDDEDGWTKKYNVGPIHGLERTMGCLRNGDIVAKNKEEEVFLFDPVTCSVKANLSIDSSKNGAYMIFDYSESLMLIGGMLPVKKQNARDKLARKKLTRACVDFML
ncbi:putative F-box/LRR-repeat/kelch-repeat protein At1g11620 [Nicotiana tabacum]|uniref:F-box/LRR-repeat/kelch-repeat protein At1g11620 n=1 Tax=Nicotiana tabacum TaxID=4097 RepID=A0A1S3XX71_TOBAC